LFVVVIVVAAAAPRSAHAQGDDYPSVVAEALREYDSSHFEEALALFRRAHELRPSARTLRGMGNAEFELRRYVDSARDLQAALDDGRQPLTRAMRAEVERVVTRARAFIGRFHVVSSVPSASVQIDGLTLADLETEIQLDAGSHHLVATAPGRIPIDRTLTVAGGEQSTIDLDFVAQPAPEPPPIAAPPPAEPVAVTPPPARDHTVGWIGVGAMALGGLALVAGIVAHVVNQSAIGSLNPLVQDGTCRVDDSLHVRSGQPDNCYSLESQYRDSEAWIYVGYVGAGVLAAAGATMFLLDLGGSSDSERPDAVTLRCAPGWLSVGCQGEF
jgi:hypothetical protein